MDIVHVETPCEERSVDGFLHDLLLKPSESRSSFAIKSGHVDTKDSHQAISLIFKAGRLSTCGPRHTLCNADIPNLLLEREYILRNFGDIREYLREIKFGSEEILLCSKKEDRRWCDEFL